MKIFTIFSPVFILALSGCTTVDDFKRMTVEERARRVCERQKNIVDISQEWKSRRNDIQSANEDLSRGYKIHTQCQQVKVYGQATTSCTRFGSQVQCSEYRPEKFETRCNESPVSINPELEKRNIQQWMGEVKMLEQKFRNEWQSCTNFISSLTPEGAYRYYK